MSIHWSGEDIELFVGNQLEDPKRSLLRDHLRNCKRCRNEVDECRKNLEAMSRIRQVFKPASKENPSPPDGLDVTGEETIEGYRLVREIHRGGQGVVYEAFQKATKRTVALKVLLGGTFASPHAKRRFEREIELAANLHHPNIITIHDSGVARGHYYLVMDYIAGEPLDKHLAEQVMSVPQKICLFLKICEAINFAHQRGVIHRDLKPSNVLVTPQGEPVILDFGLARRMEENQESDTVSHDGQLLGTPQYMAPEQADGRVSEVDARTDIYALGLILYKMLTGTHPYSTSGKMTDVLRAIQEAQPVRPSSLVRQLDRDLEVIVLKALEKESGRRYQSVAELQRDLEFWQQGMPIVARSVSSIYVLRKLITRHRYSSAMVGLLFLLVVGFSLICFDLYRKTEAARMASEVRQNKLVQEIERNHVTSMVSSFLYFIHVWNAGFNAESRELAQYMTKTREGYGADFLMNPYPLPQKELRLRKDLGASQAPFVEFVLAELLRKEGRPREAIERYKKCCSLLASRKTDMWIRILSQTRIVELSSYPKPSVRAD